MAHEKVYGICESKCKEEVLPKTQAFGITNVVVDEESSGTVNLDFPTNGKKIIICKKRVNELRISTPPVETIPNNYYSEIVIRIRFSNESNVTHTKPSSCLKVSNVKFLNDNLNISTYTILHCHFTYDGNNVCCWCTGYAE